MVRQVLLLVVQAAPLLLPGAVVGSGGVPLQEASPRCRCRWWLWALGRGGGWGGASAGLESDEVGGPGESANCNRKTTASALLTCLP